MHTIKQTIDSLTMYRMMLYFMCLLLGTATALSLVGILPYHAGDIALQTLLFVGICWGSNMLIARALNIVPNSESSIITALILSVIAGPFSLPSGLPAIVLMSTVAMLSKYVLVLHRSHVFNPAAIGVLISGFLGYSASWWVGNSALVPIILIGGMLVVRKVRRTRLVISFLSTYGILLCIDVFLVRSGDSALLGLLLKNILLSSPLLFFSFVMLIEPLTAPQTEKLRTYFGAGIAGLLFIFQWFFSQVVFSLEVSLLIGNAYARIMSPDFRQSFILRKKETLSPTVSGFWFEPVHPFTFHPGQFLEFTLPHAPQDTRGIRRYFTIASAPSEKQILLVTKFTDEGSTFKKTLKNLPLGGEIIASKVAGDFVLPLDTTQKLLFIAGGIGITPFRSMIADLRAREEQRDIILLYAAQEEHDLVFKELFEACDCGLDEISLRAVYVLSNETTISPEWQGNRGRIDTALITDTVPDLAERLCYISGPEPMVEALSKVLLAIGVSEAHLKQDYFPGYDADGDPSYR